MDPSTVQQQSIPGNKVALNSNSVGQAITAPDGHDASEERMSPPDDGASDDDAAVDDGVDQSPLSCDSDEDALAQDSRMDLDISFVLPEGLQGVGASKVPIVVLLVQIREELRQQLVATFEQGSAPESSYV
jgi:hypothetical protein